MVGEIALICPKCEDQVSYPMGRLLKPHFMCKKCGQLFTAIPVKVRAKRSRGNRASNTRDFSLRVYDTNGENLIEFTHYAYNDFELRSGDHVIISYIDGRAALIQNLTINTYYQVRAKPVFPLALAIVIIGLIFVFAAISFMAMNRHP